jgi:hypothetical protein
MNPVKYSLYYSLFFVFFCIQINFAIQPEAAINKNETIKKEVAFSLALLNDNYIATWKKDEKGNYFGADDFLTVSILGRYYLADWRYAFTYQAITSRKFNFRYDLLSVLTSKIYRVSGLIIQPQIGLIVKGDIGGKNLQNGYHSIRALKTLNYPYSSDKGVALVLGFTARWEEKAVMFTDDNLFGSFYTQVLTDFVPSRVEPALAYQLNFGDYIQAEFLVKGRFYLNMQNQYSEMVRSGIIPAFGLKIKTYQKLYFDVGIAFFPSKNLQNDIRYPPYQSRFLPQFWLAFSWNTLGISLFDYIDY